MLDPKAIQNNYLVDGLTVEQVRCISDLATERTLASGETLIRQGDEGGELFIVLDGKFCVSVGDGEELAEIGAGSVIGEMGLIVNRPRSATVEATETSRVAVIGQNDLRQELVADGNLGFVVLCNVVRVLSERLRQADTKLATLMGTNVQA